MWFKLTRTTQGCYVEEQVLWKAGCLRKNRAAASSEKRLLNKQYLRVMEY